MINLASCYLKDKSAVDAYKAAIKAKLNQAGMIRGVPRTPVNTAPLVPSTSQTPITQETFFLPGAPGPGPPGIEGPRTVEQADYFQNTTYSYGAAVPTTSGR